MGLWIRSTEHPGMWSLNQLFVRDRRPALTAEGLCGELDGELADVGHRRAVVEDDGTGRRIAPAMRDAGYDATPLMIMLLDGEPPHAAFDVRELPEDELRALHERILVEDHSVPAADVPVVVAGTAQMRAANAGTRGFAAIADGDPVAITTLFACGGVAQTEHVWTLPPYRGRGMAAAVVAHAARTAAADGAELVFLACDAAAGPFPLYAGLGFRAAGRMWTFTRPG